MVFTMNFGLSAVSVYAAAPATTEFEVTKDDTDDSETITIENKSTDTAYRYFVSEVDYGKDEAENNIAKLAQDANNGTTIAAQDKAENISVSDKLTDNAGTVYVYFADGNGSAATTWTEILQVQALQDRTSRRPMRARSMY